MARVSSGLREGISLGFQGRGVDIQSEHVG